MSFKWKGNVSYSQRKMYQRSVEKIAREDVTVTLVQDFLDLCLETLHDEFGFGDKRLNQFKERVEKKLHCINDDTVSWDDITGNIKMVEK